MFSRGEGTANALAWWELASIARQCKLTSVCLWTGTESNGVKSLRFFTVLVLVIASWFVVVGLCCDSESPNDHRLIKASSSCGDDDAVGAMKAQREKQAMDFIQRKRRSIREWGMLHHSKQFVPSSALAGSGTSRCLAPRPSRASSSQGVDTLERTVIIVCTHR